MPGQLTRGGTGSSNAPVVASSLFEDTGFTDRQPDHFPEIGSGGGSGLPKPYYMVAQSGCPLREL